MSLASEQWNKGPELEAEEFGISVDLECSNGLKMDYSECLNTCLFFRFRVNNRSNEQ